MCHRHPSSHCLCVNSSIVMQNIYFYPGRYGRKFDRVKKAQTLQNTNTKHENFHDSIQFIIRFAQYFTLLPVSGIRSYDLHELTYSTISVRTLIAILFIFFGLIEIALACYHAIRFNFHFTSMANLIFIIESTSGSILLLFLARRWKSFMIQWRTLENCFLYEPYEMDGLNLKSKIRRTGCTYFLLVFSEHMLFIASTLVYDHFQYSKCTFPGTRFINFYFAKERPHIFLYIPFNIYRAIFAYLMLVCLLFAWTFVDLLLIVICIGLITRFKQFHKRLVHNHLSTENSERFWTDLRYQFVNLLDLLCLIDNEISYLILLSCGSNLFTICFQVFNSLKYVDYTSVWVIPHILRKIHFWFAFFCLITRTFCVLYLAASVQEMGRRILNVLRDVPSKIWNNDIQCMVDLLNGNIPVALTGRKYFILTRRIILAMAATVVTYELVLMEEADYDVEDKPVCNTTRLNFIKNNY